MRQSLSNVKKNQLFPVSFIYTSYMSRGGIKLKQVKYDKHTNWLEHDCIFPKIHINDSTCVILARKNPQRRY